MHEVLDSNLYLPGNTIHTLCMFQQKQARYCLTCMQLVPTPDRTLHSAINHSIGIVDSHVLHVIRNHMKLA